MEARWVPTIPVFSLVLIVRCLWEIILTLVIVTVVFQMISPNEMGLAHAQGVMSQVRLLVSNRQQLNWKNTHIDSNHSSTLAC